jgi:hypothetical protein
LFCGKKEAKRILRKQQRKETAIEKQNFLRNLENSPGQKAYYPKEQNQLIHVMNNGNFLQNIFKN